MPFSRPSTRDPRRLGAARPGEGNRPFSGGPGTAALVTGLVQTAWILRSLRERRPGAVAFLDWDEFTGVGRGLYLWEAFVTGKAKAASHVDDALIAATTFCDSLPDPQAANAVEAERPLSLVGAALLWSGWSQEAALLHKPCLVIKASAPVAVSHMVEKAGGAAVPKHSGPGTSLHDKVSHVAEQIPLGAWTTYSCIAKIIRTIPIAVGAALAAGGIPNEHRILSSKGVFPGGAPASHVELLKAEGVCFINGRADPRQRWCPDPT
jgi:alkylated DNA nucleotide flippase Atl1